MATSAIAAAGVSLPLAEQASARLEKAGVRIGARTLYDAAKAAPGETPVKMGKQSLKLPESFIEAGRKVVTEMRELDVPNLKCMVKAELNAMIAGTPFASHFPDGVITDDVYYRFLDRSDLFSNDTRPLEDDRALWRHSSNARQQYLVWAECFVDACLAVWNPTWAANPSQYFVSAEPHDELIFWLPGAEHHVVSSDETDVAADETARGKSPAQRSVQVADPGSRRGHGRAPDGRTSKGSNKGWLKSKKQRAVEGSRDSGEVAAAKGGTKFTYVGTDLMSGDAAQTLIISQKSTEALAKKIDLTAVAPVSSLVDRVTGQKRKARYLQTVSGGVELSTMTTILEDIVLPAFPDRGHDAEARLSRAPTRDDPDDVVCWDGLKQHHSLEWIRATRRKRVRTLLRYSHGSQDNQHEDFENYAYFKPSFAAEKMKLRVDKVKAVKREAEEAGREVKAQERIAAGKLSDGDVLRCAKAPWEEAFSKERTLGGWQKEGIFPKFNCALYWRLKEEERKKEEVDVSRPEAAPDEQWLQKFNAPHSSAAKIVCDPTYLDEESIKTEAMRRFESRLEGEPAPEKLPAVGAGNLFKLKGSASGEQAAHVLREKAIEQMVEEKLKESRKDTRESKRDEKMESAFKEAQLGLAELAESGLLALKVDYLKAILLVHGKTPKGNKADLQKQLQALIDGKKGENTSQEDAISEMSRLTAVAAAARQVNDRPLALVEAAPAAAMES